MAKPLIGTIVSYAMTDGVGRIRLEDGEELRFRLRALEGLVPAVGVRVAIAATEPYPLGGRRALAVSLADDEATYAPLRDAYERQLRTVMNVDSTKRTSEHEPAKDTPRTAAGTSAPPSGGKPARALANTIRRAAPAATSAPPPADPDADRTAKRQRPSRGD